jgi:hypothetical protein
MSIFMNGVTFLKVGNGKNTAKYELIHFYKVFLTAIRSLRPHFSVLFLFHIAFFASFVFVSLVISSVSLRSETSEKTKFFRFEAKTFLPFFRFVSLQPKTNGAP